MSDDLNPTTSFSRLSHLLELDVVDIDGEVVGHIDDLLLDARGGRIRYVRLAFHGSNGRVEDRGHSATKRTRFLTVPWSAVKVESGTAAGHWRVTARRATLERLARALPQTLPD